MARWNLSKGFFPLEVSIGDCNDSECVEAGQLNQKGEPNANTAN
jgi:hypothetical protein